MLTDRKIGPIAKVPIEARATEALRQYIVEGVIQPGQRITEIRLSEDMGLSRTTVRTALHQLVQEGLVTQVPYTGWMVTALKAHDVWELYTMRASFEGLAAQLATERLPDGGRDRLEAAFAALVRACGTGNRIEIAEADFALHEVIIDLSRHTRLREMYRLIGQQIRLYIRATNDLVPNVAEIIAQHRPIVDAMLAGDVAAARSLSEKHNSLEGERLADKLRVLEAAQSGTPAAGGFRRARPKDNSP